VSGDGVQLPLAVGIELPFRPEELSRLTTPERGRVYAEVGLDAMQIGAAEAAVRAVIAKTYGKAARRRA
jgi:hypothetical protein